MQPVDVEGFGLQDYYEADVPFLVVYFQSQVIDRPMDCTIRNQIEAKNGTGYKNVPEICADVRLVFENAMKYNDERSDVHMMAKTLLEKWLQLLPKVSEEEKRREEEEAEAKLAAQEAAHAKTARGFSNEVCLGISVAFAKEI
ncbi:Transcription factor like [Actinidia chinensis var. chinensis]|uniref:Transcription factor like n=1 Tax=Actinidia chinensis var. chinensis TaxID=1590841 RepID=A0A2R6RTT6_ACTCC|nr:Transcription factor like [Actinidia chinensis var. chinensis]